jgi:hypothetical protein
MASWKERADVIQMQPPYEYMKNVNVSAADDSLTGYDIFELRCKTEGAVKIDTKYATGVTWYANDYDILRVRVTKIYMTGTDAGLQNGSIQALGFPAAPTT